MMVKLLEIHDQIQKTLELMAQKFSREIEIHACKKADERSLHEATAEACEVKSP